MKNCFKATIFTILLSTAFSAVFITEITDPQNSSSAGRYLELFNNGNTDTDLSTGWALQRWTNGNSGPQSPVDLTGTIAAGGFYIICNDADKFSSTYGLTCDQDVGTGGAADSNGDDNIALLDATGTIADMFGVAGEDGTGTGHEFEDGRAERAAGVTAGNPVWYESEWNIDNDSGGGDGNQYAPEGFDPGEWIGASSSGDICEDESACNNGSEGACEYPDPGYDCEGNCIGELDCSGVCGGSAVNDCFDVCGGDAIVDDCGICGGDNSSCSVNVTFQVNMTIEGVIEGNDIKVRTSTINGEYSPSSWYVMADTGDGIYAYTMSLLTGVTYGYNFNNSDGSGYESGSDLENCAGGNYGNDRFVTPGDSDMELNAVCWESCDSCPEDIPGCTDDTALNYDENATVDDGSCIYEWPDPDNLFFSEFAEGSSNNKYLEIYNATGGDVNLSGYSLSSCSNGCNETDIWDYPDNVTFDLETTIVSGDVYVVCHGSANETIQSECDQTFTYLSNGDDVFALTQIGSGTILDIIGTTGDDPGSGWEVAGVSNATKDHTLVRKSTITTGSGNDWATSAGTDSDNSEWVVFDQNTWDYIGNHPHEFCTTDECGVCDNDPTNDCQELSILYDFDQDITGFQFDLSGVTIVENTVSGGSAGEYFDLVTSNATTVIGISFSNTPIPAGTGTLTNLMAVGDLENATLENVTVTDENTQEVESTTEGLTIYVGCVAGDVNFDGVVNVTDIMDVLYHILDITQLSEQGLCAADVFQDGIINVVDIVNIVPIILNGKLFTSTYAEITKLTNGMHLLSDGTVGAIQLELFHGSDFELVLTGDAFISEYNTIGNSTKIIIVMPENGILFESSGFYEITDVIAANAEGLISITQNETPSEFSVMQAYPNPFNPSTTLDIYLPRDGHISSTIYNVSGRKIHTLADGIYDAGMNTFTWSAVSDVVSGVYFIRTEYNNSIHMQKVVLIK